MIYRSTIPRTARKHFDEDIARAIMLLIKARSTRQPDLPVTIDIARCSVAFGVGALDAYLCDAFVDVLARTLKGCRQTGEEIPAAYASLRMPVGPLIAEYQQRENWGLRMSARTLMEKDNVLQTWRIKELFNPALKRSHKLWGDLIESYIALNRKRLTGIDHSAYVGLSGERKQKATKKAIAVLLGRITEIIQRRHDIVHNCDRPKSAVQGLTLAAASKMLSDVQVFVQILDDHLDAHRAYP
ncbi:MAG TPA: HEPN domain-containing protein [Solirubrobacteraceae bacterium]